MLFFRYLTDKRVYADKLKSDERDAERRRLAEDAEADLSEEEEELLEDLEEEIESD